MVEGSTAVGEWTVVLLVVVVVVVRAVGQIMMSCNGGGFDWEGCFW